MIRSGRLATADPPLQVHSNQVLGGGSNRYSVAMLTVLSLLAVDWSLYRRPTRIDPRAN